MVKHKERNVIPDKRLRYIQENQDSLGTAREKLILFMLNSEAASVPMLS